MQTIQVVLDPSLLEAADRAARDHGVNRSQLIRDALREHLSRLRLREMEERDRQGYAVQPVDAAEAGAWEAEALWPGN